MNEKKPDKIYTKIEDAIKFVEIYLPDGKAYEFVVGEEGVHSIFVDRQHNKFVRVVAEDYEEVYHGLPFMYRQNRTKVKIDKKG